MFYLHLTVRPDLSEDLSDLGLEAHVQHPVRLVQDDVRAPPEVGLVHLKVPEHETPSILHK